MKDPRLCVLVMCATAVANALPSPIGGQGIPLATDTFVVSYGGSIIGHGITARALVEAQLIQVYTWRSGGSPDIVDSLFSDRETLQSLREVRLVGDTVIVATYTPDSIVIETRASNGPDRRTAVASGGAYYSSAALEALVTDAALAPGSPTVVRLYYAPPSAIGFHEANLRVVRSERIAAREGPQRNAWVVTAGTAGGVTTFWIDKATRTVLKYDTREGRALIEFRR